jgi:ribosomal protein S18 acetylase RimI-like enzyme
MGEKMTIRKSCIDDVGQIHELFFQSDIYQFNNESFNYIYKKPDEIHRGEDYIKYLINSDKHILVVIEEENKIIGLLCGHEEESPSEPYFIKRKYLHIENIVVDEKYRNKGYGSQLLEYIKNYCKEKGYSDIILETFGYNSPAIRMYEKNSFITLKREMFFKI